MTNAKQAPNGCNWPGLYPTGRGALKVPNWEMSDEGELHDFDREQALAELDLQGASNDELLIEADRLEELGDTERAETLRRRLDAQDEGEKVPF